MGRRLKEKDTRGLLSSPRGGKRVWGGKRMSRWREGRDHLEKGSTLKRKSL